MLIILKGFPIIWANCWAHLFIYMGPLSSHVGPIGPIGPSWPKFGIPGPSRTFAKQIQILGFVANLWPPNSQAKSASIDGINTGFGPMVAMGQWAQ